MAGNNKRLARKAYGERQIDKWVAFVPSTDRFVCKWINNQFTDKLSVNRDGRFEL